MIIWFFVGFFIGFFVGFFYHYGREGTTYIPQQSGGFLMHSIESQLRDQLAISEAENEKLKKFLRDFMALRISVPKMNGIQYTGWQAARQELWDRAAELLGER